MISMTQPPEFNWKRHLEELLGEGLRESRRKEEIYNRQMDHLFEERVNQPNAISRKISH